MLNQAFLFFLCRIYFFCVLNTITQYILVRPASIIPSTTARVKLPETMPSKGVWSMLEVKRALRVQMLTTDLSKKRFLGSPQRPSWASSLLLAAAASSSTSTYVACSSCVRLSAFSGDRLSKCCLFLLIWWKINKGVKSTEVVLH